MIALKLKNFLIYLEPRAKKRPAQRGDPEKQSPGLCISAGGLRQNKDIQREGSFSSGSFFCFASFRYSFGLMFSCFLKLWEK